MQGEVNARRALDEGDKKATHKHIIHIGRCMFEYSLPICALQRRFHVFIDNIKSI